jgi:hypothetical protein
VYFTVQFIGSMHACARNGVAYTASTFTGVAASAAGTSPTVVIA